MIVEVGWAVVYSRAGTKRLSLALAAGVQISWTDLLIWAPSAQQGTSGSRDDVGAGSTRECLFGGADK